MSRKRPSPRTLDRSKHQKSSPRKYPDILSVARKSFGFKQLRPNQRQAVESLLSGTDTLVVMPTGSGKSAIYQIAGLMLPRPVLVVSPLIVLQKDQVDSINDANGKAEACVINSSCPFGKRAWRYIAFVP